MVSHTCMIAAYVPQPGGYGIIGQITAIDFPQSVLYVVVVNACVISSSPGLFLKHGAAPLFCVVCSYRVQFYQ
jgi:hypothetical protein